MTFRKIVSVHPLPGSLIRPGSAALSGWSAWTDSERSPTVTYAATPASSGHLPDPDRCLAAEHVRDVTQAKPARVRSCRRPTARRSTPMRAFLVLAALAAALAVPASAATWAQPSVAAHASKYGRILFDGRGFALYSFTRDPRGRSTCGAACAKK